MNLFIYIYIFINNNNNDSKNFNTWHYVKFYQAIKSFFWQTDVKIVLIIYRVLDSIKYLENSFQNFVFRIFTQQINISFNFLLNEVLSYVFLIVKNSLKFFQVFVEFRK